MTERDEALAGEDEEDGTHESTIKMLFRERDSDLVPFIDFYFTADANKRGAQSQTIVPPQIAATVGASRTFFEKPEQVEEWRARTLKIFGAQYGQALIDALGGMLHSSSTLALIEMDLMPAEKEALLRDHLAVAEKVLRRRFGLDAGRPRQWSAMELSASIARAMAALKLRERNYDGVAKKLQETQPERAPTSGESLRKLIKFYQIDWKRIKRDTERKAAKK